jgi:hypothetical protein
VRLRGDVEKIFLKKLLKLLKNHLKYGIMNKGAYTQGIAMMCANTKGKQLHDILVRRCYI